MGINFLFVRMNKAILLLVLLLGVALSQSVKSKSGVDCRLKVSKNGRCGKRYLNARCNFGYCSRWGWGGTSPAHKRGSQKKYNFAKCGKKVVKKVSKKGGKPKAKVTSKKGKKPVKKVKIVLKKAKIIKKLVKSKALKKKIQKAKKAVKKTLKKAKKAKKV